MKNSVSNACIWFICMKLYCEGIPVTYSPVITIIHPFISSLFISFRISGEVEEQWTMRKRKNITDRKYLDFGCLHSSVLYVCLLLLQPTKHIHPHKNDIMKWTLYIHWVFSIVHFYLLWQITLQLQWEKFISIPVFHQNAFDGDLHIHSIIFSKGVRSHKNEKTWDQIIHQIILFTL